MKNTIHQLLVNAFGLIVGIAILAGAFVGVLFVFAIIINGGLAASISQFNAQIMDWSKLLACIAIWIGLVDFYLQKEHHLTIDSED